jgi:hypothetical protein
MGQKSMNQTLYKNLLKTGTIFIALGLASCSKVGSNSTVNTLPAPVGSASDNYIIKAKAEFDVTSSPSGSAQWQLVKKSYASGVCTHGQCTDYTDITVTNTTNTDFQINDSQENITENVSNTDLTNFLTLNVVTLFDNDLFECGANLAKCLSASILTYTTSPGTGLYNSANQQSIPLLITSPYNPTNVAIGTFANPTILQQITIPQSEQTVQLINLGNTAIAGPNYVLSSDFTTAGVGMYTAHVVVAYALNGFQVGVIDHFALSFPATVNAGTANNLTIEAQDVNNNVLTNYLGSVTISSTDPLATITPTTYQFLPADAGVKNISVTLNTTGNESVTVIDNLNITATSTTLVQASLAVTPAIQTLGTNTIVPMVISGGVPPYTASLTTEAASTGSLSGSTYTYTAGDNSTQSNLTDTVMITDSALNTVSSTFTVTPDVMNMIATDSFGAYQGAIDYSTCYVYNSLYLRCWGYNAYANLGIGNSSTATESGLFVSSPIDTTIPLGILPITQVETTYNSTFIVTNGGILEWGSGQYDIFGNSTTIPQATAVSPVGLAPGTAGVTVSQIATFVNQACAIVNGGVQCWGNTSGGNVLNQFPTPTPIAGLNSGVTDVSVNEYASCAIMSGSVWCWGSNYVGQFPGLSYSLNNIPPTQVSGISGATAVVVGNEIICAIVSGGVECWGGNGNGEAGTGPSTIGIVNPSFATGLGAGSGITMLAAGSGYEVCAASSTTIYCWGSGPSESYQNVPTVVTTSGTITSLSVGDSNICAIVGNVPECWGTNVFGQIGNGTLASSTLPAPATYTNPPTCPSTISAYPTGGLTWSAVEESCICSTAGYSFDSTASYCHTPCTGGNVWSTSSLSCVAPSCSGPLCGSGVIGI